jgi:hypothetical protein
MERRDSPGAFRVGEMFSCDEVVVKTESRILIFATSVLCSCICLYFFKPNTAL